ncbi:MAG: hypothetical protein AB7U85_10720 [Alphaproteobacteria bacterium]
MINRRHKISECSGRTMIEMIAVLGLISVMAVGSIMLIHSVYERFAIFRSRTQLASIVETVRKYYANDFNYQGVSVSGLINNKLTLPDTVSGSKIVLATGGEVTSAGYETTTRAFSLTIKAQTKLECYGILDVFIDQVDSSQSAYKLIHTLNDSGGNSITYAWSGNTDCTVNPRHFNCMSSTTNFANCNDGSVIQVFYY